MTYRCCETHDLLDDHIAAIAAALNMASPDSPRRQYLEQALISAVDRSAIGIEQPDGSIHLRRHE